MYKAALTIALLLSTLSPSPTAAGGSYNRTINFSGHSWLVKSSTEQIGPGPNYFSDTAKNVWVDTNGRLHLKITNVKGQWHCAEVVSQESFGFGCYRFYLDTPVNNLNPNVVLGLFTWDDQPDYNNREIDIELSRWGVKNNQSAQYVVQPYTVPDNMVRFNEPPSVPQSIHSFVWSPTEVIFQSVKGTNPVPVVPTDTILQWTFTGIVPQAGGENARMNLWLMQGLAPTDGKQVEVIVRDFEFIPLAEYTARFPMNWSNFDVGIGSPLKFKSGSQILVKPPLMLKTSL